MELLQVPGLRSWLQPLISGHYSVWVVLTELLLIGIPVFMILRFLRGTRGERLTQAVGLILVISFLIVRVVAERLQLDRVTFLYPYFVMGVALVALVVYQPELRRGLIRLGERGLLRAWKRSAMHTIDPLVSAVARLSKNKIGALIAVEHTTSLGAITESGVRLDAAASSELLEAIFWPGSPLHDMGVVVQTGRVAAAGCQFPLAESEEVDRSLGSRHRAALGLSNECDAVIVVVSEETGIISVARYGRLRRNLSPAALRDLLVAAFGKDAAPPALPAPERAGPAEPERSPRGPVVPRMSPVSELAPLVESKQNV